MQTECSPKELLCTNGFCFFFFSWQCTKVLKQNLHYIVYICTQICCICWQTVIRYDDTLLILNGGALCNVVICWERILKHQIVMLRLCNGVGFALELVGWREGSYVARRGACRREQNQSEEVIRSHDSERSCVMAAQHWHNTGGGWQTAHKEMSHIGTQDSNLSLRVFYLLCVVGFYCLFLWPLSWQWLSTLKLQVLSVIVLCLQMTKWLLYNPCSLKKWMNHIHWREVGFPRVWTVFLGKIRVGVRILTLILPLTLV